MNDRKSYKNVNTYRSNVRSMSQLAKLFKPQYQFYCGLKHQWVRSAIDNTYRKLDDRVARPDEMLEGAVQAYKYFSTKMISMDDASDLEHIVTGNMLSVMKEERESSTGMEFREQFDIGEEKTMTWLNVDAYLDGFVSLDEDMNPQFRWLMVDPTELTKDDDENGKLRKIPVHKYMLSVTYFADYKATWTDGEVDTRIDRLWFQADATDDELGNWKIFRVS